jgi:cytochrome c-type biogenesis protein CcmF
VIAELGLGALWLAAALALLQLVLSALGLGKGRAELLSGVRPVAVAQAVLIALSFGSLITLFLRSDMSVLLVAMNSHSAKPWLYKFAGTWGNHEGSMLLWVTVMGLAGALVALLERTLKRETHMATLGAQAAISLGFYAFLLFASNPFARLNPAAPDGQGLNPLLQDPGLAFHPPTLYLGYVGLSVAFSFAVGALLTRTVDASFARAMRPWVLGAWVLLTIGITAGSYWAYYELGWGGWWFWDPVENASLMPWLAATALLHSVTVLATARCPARMDDHARGRRLLDVDGWHLSRALGHPYQRSCLRGGPGTRHLHPRPARDLHRRRARPIWSARRHGARGAAVRGDEPRDAAGGEQSAAHRHPRRGAGRHALSADDGSLRP